MNAAAGTAAVVFCALYAAHAVGDHWVQTEHQAATKGARSWAGRIACTAHVLTLTLTQLAALVAVVLVLGVELSGWQVAAGLAVNAISHWWADRRATLAALATAVGHGPFYGLGAPRAGRDDNPSLGTGAYAMDQSWHIGWLFVSTLVVAA